MKRVFSTTRNFGVTALLITLLALPAQAKGKNKTAFPLEPFLANDETVSWLLAYDTVAWKSSDLLRAEPREILQQLGGEWFCFQQGETWHAVYGRYDKDTDTYIVVVHYVYQEDGSLLSASTAIENENLDSYGRAIYKTSQRLPESMTRLGLQFNTYVQPLGKDQFAVWILPGGQRDGTLIFGGEIRYLFDGQGEAVLDEQVNFKQFRGIRPDPGIDLAIDRQENDLPSVGDIFFLRSNVHLFQSITILNRCSSSNVLEVENQEPIWFHALREEEDCDKKSRKRRQREKSKQEKEKRRQLKRERS